MKIKITNPNYDCMAYGFEIGDILDATIYDSEFYKVTNNGINYLIHKNTACEYAQIKERYMNDNEIAEFIETITPRMEVDIEAMDKIKELDNKHKINQAITLLQSNGYKVEPPYTQPTDEEIIARLKIDNKKHNGIFNYYIFYSSRGEYTWGADGDDERVLGVTYTTQSIAQQIVTELNEKRFVRVD